LVRYDGLEKSYRPFKKNLKIKKHTFFKSVIILVLKEWVMEKFTLTNHSCEVLDVIQGGKQKKLQKIIKKQFYGFFSKKGKFSCF
jgi:hypothetical protein